MEALGKEKSLHLLRDGGDHRLDPTQCNSSVKGY